MELEQWWPKLSSPTQQWLIEHNGEVLSGDIVTAITQAGGSFSADAWWFESAGHQPGLSLTDEAVDWIEAVANGEVPTPRH